MFCLLAGISLVLASDTSQTYHVAIVGYLAAGLVLTSFCTNNLIYTSNIAKEVATAGFISLSIASVYTTIPKETAGMLTPA